MRVGVLLPRAHVAGGVKRATLMIVELLLSGASAQDQEISLVLGINGDPVTFLDGQRALPDPRITVRAIRFQKVSETEAQAVMSLQGDSLPDSGEPGRWAVVRDDGPDMLDCDVWLQITTRVGGESDVLPLVPVRPVVLVPFDFLEAYGFALPSDPAWRGSRRVVRSVSRILVSTSETGRDAIAYMGCPAERVVLTPVEFFRESHSCEGQSESPATASRSTYIVWVTNASRHKNASRIVAALIRVARANPDFRCIVVGYGSEDLADGIEIPREQVSLRGYVSEAEYCHLLAGSRFLLHGATHDNGSYSPLDAALHGVPSVCSDYPAMREVMRSAGLACSWFDPFDISDIAGAIERAWLHPGPPVGPASAVFPGDLASVSRRWFAAVGPVLEGLVDAR